MSAAVFLILMILFSCAGNPDHNIPSQVERKKEFSQVSVIKNSSCDMGLYKKFNSLRTEGPLIPGLLDFPVPQGMAYLEDSDLMIISNYMSDKTAGVLSILDMKSGNLEKVLYLYNHDKKPHTGHLGGLAASREYLWIASGSGIYSIPLQEIMEAENASSLYLPPLIETETKGSFATYSKGTLWIGEFTRKDGSYSVPSRHHRTTRTGASHRAWLGGYKLESLTNRINTENRYRGKSAPDYVLSIPDEVQGALFYNEMVLLSASYGRKNYSRLYLYKNPLSEENHVSDQIFEDDKISFHFLDDQNLRETVILPPMSEALVLYKDSLALLFESAASKYRETAQYPLERIQFIPLSALESSSF